MAWLLKLCTKCDLSKAKGMQRVPKTNCLATVRIGASALHVSRGHMHAHAASELKPEDALAGATFLALSFDTEAFEDSRAAFLRKSSLCTMIAQLVTENTISSSSAAKLIGPEWVIVSHRERSVTLGGGAGGVV